jgi:TusA-related sulfurtransferase
VSTREDVPDSGLRTAEKEEVVARFDAGNMGCGEGLPMEFRRRMQDIALGSSIEVVVHDPSAKEDLPSLARLMGHRVRGVEERDDGSMAVVVERAR